jgi:hypothetical protein
VGVTNFNAAGRRLDRTTSLPTSIAFTIAGFVYVNTISTVFQIFASLNDTADANFISIGFTQTVGNALSLFTHGGASDFPSRPPTGEWVFFAITNNNTNAVGYWARLNAATFVSISRASPSSFTPTFLSIGSDNVDEFADVRLANVKVWNRALTSAELLREKTIGRPYDATSINLFSPLAGPGDVRDYSGNGRNWTVVGTALQQVAGPPIGLGDFNGL